MESMVHVSERTPSSIAVKNVMEALLTQNNDGDTKKFVNEILPLLKILPPPFGGKTSKFDK